MERELVKIRFANSDDSTALAELIVAYLQFYQMTDIPSTSALQHLIKTICEDSAKGYFLLAEMKKTAIGFATLYKIFSTFQAKPALILNDLFVLPDYRNVGVGRQLFKECERIYRHGGYAYLEWMTPRDNQQAIDFYLKNNAKKTNWIVFTQP